MTNYEHRKLMWIFLSRIFYGDIDELEFIWMYSDDDIGEANTLPDGTAGVHCAGVIRGVV